MKRTKKKLQYFHASPKRLKIKDQILPGGNVGKRNFNCSLDNFVYLTTSQFCHYTVVHIAVQQNWFIYEVEPDGKLMVGDWGDVLAPSATILKCVGRARGIMKAKLRKKAKVDLEDPAAIHGEDLMQYFHWDPKLPSSVEPLSLPHGTKYRNQYAKHNKVFLSYNTAYSESYYKLLNRERLTLRERLRLYRKLGIHSDYWQQMEERYNFTR